jgi:hypothetical protein
VQALELLLEREGVERRVTVGDVSPMYTPTNAETAKAESRGISAN